MEGENDMKYGDIVVYDNEIGKVVTAIDENDFRFLPCNRGICSFSSLDMITEETIRETTHEEKIGLITKEYTWGEVIKVHCIGEYQIVEAIRERGGETHFHGYINYRDTNTSYSSLDSALVGCIGIKYEGGNGKAAMYFNKMIGIA